MDLVFSTFDGGISWTERTDIPIYEANDVYFSDSNKGWIISANKLYRTIDGGNTWFLDPQIYTYTTHFETISKNNFIITGTIIYESIDTGQVWQTITNEIGNYFTGLQAPESYLAYSVGPAGLILKYIDTVYTPVELTYFSANVNQQNVLLNWATTTETNNKGFLIERQSALPIQSINHSANLWKQIGFVEGNGTTTLPHNYSFTDNAVEAGTYYYRLKQIDFDGSYKYSKEVEVDVTAPNKFSLEQNYPNPFNPVTTIKYSIPAVTLRQAQSDIRVTLKVYNTLGEEVATLVNEQKSAGNYEVKFDGSRLPSGVYIYRLTAVPNGGQGESFSKSIKLILLK